jgi:histidinol-phosphate aminotransferase
MDANAGVLKLSPYIAGKPIEEVAREFNLKMDEIIKLASNENPNGLSLKAVAAIEQTLKDGTRYPDSNGFNLKQKLATKFQIKPEMITLGAGSNEILDFIARVFLNDKSSAVFAQYAFAVYQIVADMANAASIVIPALNYAHDLPAMAVAVQANTKVIFLANPNNPTGTQFTLDQLTAFLKQIPSNVVVVLDEAYVEYRPTFNSFDLLKDYPNLIICRTFSKAYGLASLRIGYSVSSIKIADLLNRVRAPFNVTEFALKAAEAVLDDMEYLQKTVAVNQQGLVQLEDGFKKLDIEYIPSFGNFITFKIANASRVNLELLKNGVIVRPLNNYGMNDFLRVSVGLKAENQRFLEALGQIIQ